MIGFCKRKMVLALDSRGLGFSKIWNVEVATLFEAKAP